MEIATSFWMEPAAQKPTDNPGYTNKEITLHSSLLTLYLKD